MQVQAWSSCLQMSQNISHALMPGGNGLHEVNTQHPVVYWSAKLLKGRCKAKDCPDVAVVCPAVLLLELEHAAARLVP